MTAVDYNVKHKVYMNYVHPSSMLQHLAGLWRNGILCDAILTVDNMVVGKAHKPVLFAASSKIQMMYTDPTQNFNSDISLPSGVNTSAVTACLQYLYEGFLALTTQHVQDIYKISKFLEIESIVKCCEDFMSRVVPGKNDMPGNSSGVTILGSHHQYYRTSETMSVFDQNFHSLKRCLISEDNIPVVNNDVNKRPRLESVHTQNVSARHLISPNMHRSINGTDNETVIVDEKMDSSTDSCDTLNSPVIASAVRPPSNGQSTNIVNIPVKRKSDSPDVKSTTEAIPKIVFDCHGNNTSKPLNEYNDEFVQNYSFTQRSSPATSSQANVPKTEEDCVISKTSLKSVQENDEDWYDDDICIIGSYENNDFVTAEHRDRPSKNDHQAEMSCIPVETPIKREPIPYDINEIHCDLVTQGDVKMEPETDFAGTGDMCSANLDVRSADLRYENHEFSPFTELSPALLSKEYAAQFTPEELLSNKMVHGKYNSAQLLFKLLLKEGMVHSGMWDNPPLPREVTDTQDCSLFDFIFNYAPQLHPYKTTMWKKIRKSLLNRRTRLQVSVSRKVMEAPMS